MGPVLSIVIGVILNVTTVLAMEEVRLLHGIGPSRVARAARPWEC
jgi:hypothetical protein